MGANCRHELRIAPRWGRNYIPRRILDEIRRRYRKNEHRDAKKPILRKTAFRTDGTAPILGKNGFVLMRLRFTPCRRQLTALPGMILEITNSYSGIWFKTQTAYGVFPNAAAADNRFSGVGAQPSLLTIPSV